MPRHWPALQHRTKGALLPEGIGLAGAGLLLSFAVAESEANEQALVHLVLALGHALERHLLLVHLLVLGHVLFVGEVVEVARVRLRVQLGNEGGLGLTENLPVDLGKVLVSADILDVAETLGPRVDASGLGLALT